MSVIKLYDVAEAKGLDLPWPDVYETPGYAEADLCSQGPGTTWELAVWQPEGGGIFIAYGYFKRPVLNQGKTVGHDLSTCYGYAAPFATAPVTPEVWAAFRRDFEELCSKQQYAAEFIRFAPLRLEETLAFIEGCTRVSTTLKCWHHQTTIAIKLDAYWERAAKNHRRSVAKAQKLGHSAEIRLATLADVASDSPFVQLYNHTMQRVAARDFYFFPVEYYETLIKSLPSGCLYVVLIHAPLAEAEAGGEVELVPSIAAAALYFHFGRHFHYHLGASETSYLRNGVNNLVHDAAARYGRDTLGCELLHLGGGLKKDDPLFNFKRSIGDVELKWYLGKSVLATNVYDWLVALRAAHLGMTPEALVQQTDFHPVYRDGVVGNELVPISVKPLSVYALIANSQRWATVKALAELASAGRIDLSILIPSGVKYEEFGSQLAAEKLNYKHAKKAEFEGLVLAASPAIVLTCGWPFILTASLLGASSTVFINSHPSLLPKHRGSSPFWAAIMANDTRAGTTVHRTDEGVDTGPILRQEWFPIDLFDTYASIKEKSFEAEAVNVRESILTLLEALQHAEPMSSDGVLVSGAAEVAKLFTPQKLEEQEDVTPRRTPEDSEIDPGKSLLDLYNHIRTCGASFPAFFYIDGQKVNIQLSREHRPEDAHPETL